MSDFLDHLRSGCERCGLRGRKVLLAVSGGADSMALVRGMLELRAEFNLSLHAAHLDHQLRGELSRQDSLWVERTCAAWEIALTLGQRNVPAEAARRKLGLEEAARRVRYEFLDETARAEGCTHLAVAHTADDQVETVMHHILRGTGLAGLRGVPRTRTLPSGIVLVRPLLAANRQEIESYLASLGQDFRQDESNADPQFTRTRLRHHLLPLLEREFNPQVRRALLRLAEQARQVEEALACAAGRVLDEALVETSPAACRLDCSPLKSLPVHLLRECFVLLWKRQEWPRQRLGSAALDRLVALVQGEKGRQIHLPGPITATKKRGELILRHTPAEPAE